MASEPRVPTQDQIEDAVKKTLYGWADELDDGPKFWWGDWATLIGDAITAVRTGEPVLYPEERMTEPPLEGDSTPIGSGRGSEVKRMLRAHPADSLWSHDLAVTRQVLHAVEFHAMGKSFGEEAQEPPVWSAQRQR